MARRDQAIKQPIRMGNSLCGWAARAVVRNQPDGRRCLWRMRHRNPVVMVAEAHQGEAHRAQHGERLGGVVAPTDERLHQVALLRQKVLGFTEVPARLPEIVMRWTHAGMIARWAPRATLGDVFGVVE
jgi:hypothetical protein